MAPRTRALSVVKNEPKRRYHWVRNQLIYGGVSMAQISYDDGRVAAALTLEHGQPYYKVYAFNQTDGLIAATNFDTIEHAREWAEVYVKEGRDESMKPAWLQKVDGRVDPVKDALNTERALAAIEMGPIVAQREENPDQDDDDGDGEG